MSNVRVCNIDRHFDHTLYIWVLGCTFVGGCQMYVVSGHMGAGVQCVD